jgi:RNA polymerase sigma factor (TIGR02999 family)
MAESGDPSDNLNSDRAASRESEELLPLLYEQLHQQAEKLMREERLDHTLQPTALVHEAWLRLGKDHQGMERASFFRMAAICMRRVLIDHARTRSRGKRGGGRVQLSLDDALASFEERTLDVLALDEALNKMESFDPELARIVELRFFSGLTIAETAAALEVSTPTIERAWRVARSWLLAELKGSPRGS